MLTRFLRPCLRVSMAVFILLTVAACGQKFASQSANCTTCIGSGTELSSPDLDAIWDQADVAGKVTEGQYAGIESVQVDRSQNLIILNLPVPGFLSLPAIGSSFPLSQLPGASVEIRNVTYQNTMSNVIVIKLPLATVLKGSQLPRLKLPLQTILTETELPGLNFDQSQIPITLYTGAGQVVLFVHFPFDPPVSFMSSIKNKTQTKTLGYLNALRDSDNGGDGGYFMYLRISPSVSRILDQLL